MLWQSINNDACDVCQCSRMVKTSFELHEKLCGTNRSFTHDSDCSTSYTHDTEADAETEKENTNFGGSPVKPDSEISFYGSSSPSSRTKCESPLCNSSPQKCHYMSKSSRPAMEEFDLNSQDSGYSTSLTDKESKVFSFVRSRDAGPAPIVGQVFGSPTANRASTIFQAFSSGSMESMESMDDGFLEMEHFENDENAQLPVNFNTLLSGSLAKNATPVSHQSRTRPSFRRSVSLKEGSPVSRTARSSLFPPTTPELFDNRSFKRPEPPVDMQSPVQMKRLKSNQQDTSQPMSLGSPVSGTSAPSATSASGHPRIQRSFSANAATIMSAVQRSSTDPDLIGDFSRPFYLPLIAGRHQDLKSISPSTLADLINGKYNDAIGSFKIIDCRYPYEFDGGHIFCALNMFTKEQIVTELVDVKTAKPFILNEMERRHILVFHCEFSSERAPNLSRFLRNLDRTKNNESYPALHYPEIYILDGGYKKFFGQYPTLCQPIAYKAMLDPAHEMDLRHFRAKSKTWNADSRIRPTHSRTSLKRLGFS